MVGAMAGQRDAQGARQPWIAEQFMADLVTAHARQTDIAHDNIRFHRSRDGQSIGSRVRDKNRVAIELENHPRAFRQVEVVVDDQNATAMRYADGNGVRASVSGLQVIVDRQLDRKRGAATNAIAFNRHASTVQFNQPFDERKAESALIHTNNQLQRALSLLFTALRVRRRLRP